MRWALFLVLAACGGAAARGPASAPAPTTFTPAQIAEKTTPSIVLIKTETMIGTGFVVWKDGRIATNLHVIAGAHKATVTLNDGRSFDEVYVLGVDQAHDLAIIRVAADNLVPLTLGDSGAVKAGEHVVAIGNPMGLGNTVSDGLVSAVRVLDPKLTLLQISAPIAPGSSGGPILNERAEVIGVATLYSAEGQNLNFGVPIAYLKPLLLAEKPTPLSAFSQLLDMALFEGCSGEDVKMVVTELSEAIKVGVPLYNAGDEQGCYDVYEKTSLKLVGALKTCPAVRETLLGGLSNANRVQKPGEKAWALRHAFDRVLNAFEAAVKAHGNQ